MRVGVGDQAPRGTEVVVDAVCAAALRGRGVPAAASSARRRETARSAAVSGGGGVATSRPMGGWREAVTRL